MARTGLDAASGHRAPLHVSSGEYAIDAFTGFVVLSSSVHNTRMLPHF